MPERILRDWTDSDKFDGFAGSPETLFTRLLMKVDDYGRFTRDPINVRAACFPRAEALRANTVDAWLKELSDHRLILCYQVNGKWFLAIINFRQRLRVDGKGHGPRPKFPPPEGKPVDFRPDDGDWRESAATCGGSPPYAYAGPDAEPGPNASNPPPLINGHGEKGSGEKPSTAACREIPDEDQAWSMTMTLGAPEDFVRRCYRQWAMQGGKNGNDIACEFLVYVTGRWKNERNEYENGTHRFNREANGRSSGSGRINPRHTGQAESVAEKSASGLAALRATGEA